MLCLVSECHWSCIPLYLSTCWWVTCLWGGNECVCECVCLRLFVPTGNVSLLTVCLWGTRRDGGEETQTWRERWDTVEKVGSMSPQAVQKETGLCMLCGCESTLCYIQRSRAKPSTCNLPLPTFERQTEVQTVHVLTPQTCRFYRGVWL